MVAVYILVMDCSIGYGYWRFDEKKFSLNLNLQKENLCEIGQL